MIVLLANQKLHLFMFAWTRAIDVSLQIGQSRLSASIKCLCNETLSM